MNSKGILEFVIQSSQVKITRLAGLDSITGFVSICYFDQKWLKKSIFKNISPDVVTNPLLPITVVINKEHRQDSDNVSDG